MVLQWNGWHSNSFECIKKEVSIFMSNGYLLYSVIMLKSGRLGEICLINIVFRVLEWNTCFWLVLVPAVFQPCSEMKIPLKLFTWFQFWDLLQLPSDNLKKKQKNPGPVLFCIHLIICKIMCTLCFCSLKTPVFLIRLLIFLAVCYFVSPNHWLRLEKCIFVKACFEGHYPAHWGEVQVYCVLGLEISNPQYPFNE